MGCPVLEAATRAGAEDARNSGLEMGKDASGFAEI